MILNMEIQNWFDTKTQHIKNKNLIDLLYLYVEFLSIFYFLKVDEYTVNIIHELDRIIKRIDNNSMFLNVDRIAINNLTGEVIFEIGNMSIKQSDMLITSDKIEDIFSLEFLTYIVDNNKYNKF